MVLRHHGRILGPKLGIEGKPGKWKLDAKAYSVLGTQDRIITRN
jgi:hypothetical protein